MVAFLAKLLQEDGLRPAILSRGYGRKSYSETLLVRDFERIYCRSSRECGDEPYFLAQSLEDVPIAVGKRRYLAGTVIEKHCGDVIHILDDGYQHLQLRRDLNLLMVDATDPFGGGEVVPLGRLREPLSALRRADHVVVTRSHMPSDHEALEALIRRWNKLTGISYFYHDATGIVDIRTGERAPLRSWINKPVTALAAIANPSVFKYDLNHYQIRVVAEFWFRDHHPYTQAELDGILRRTAEMKSEAVLTTEKDAIRLRGLNFDPGRIYALQIETRPENPEKFRKFIREEINLLSFRRRRLKH